MLREAIAGADIGTVVLSRERMWQQVQIGIFSRYSSFWMLYSLFTSKRYRLQECMCMHQYVLWPSVWVSVANFDSCFQHIGWLPRLSLENPGLSKASMLPKNVTAFNVVHSALMRSAG